MAALALQVPTPAGLTVTFAAATYPGGDTMPAGDHNSARFKNPTGGSITVTIASPTACSYGFTHTVPVVVAAGGEATSGPLPAWRYGDTTGTVSFTYSATGLTVAAVQT